MVARGTGRSIDFSPATRNPQSRALWLATLGAPFTGPGYVGGDDATPGVKTVEVRDLVNLSAATQRWLRVKVTH